MGVARRHRAAGSILTDLDEAGLYAYRSAVVPRGLPRPLPGVVQYMGYGGGRGHMYEALLWSAAGYAHLMCDVRGQGANHHPGATGDPVGPSGPVFPGLMTNGIESPSDYYYRRVFTDSVRAVDALAACPDVDATRIAQVVDAY